MRRVHSPTTDMARPAAIDALLQSPTGGSRPLFIWGAGRGGVLARQMLAGHGVQPTGFIDRDPAKIGTTLHGLRVFPPEHLSATDAPRVLVASVHAREILGSLRATGHDSRDLFVYEAGTSSIHRSDESPTSRQRRTALYETVLGLEALSRALLERESLDESDRTHSAWLRRHVVPALLAALRASGAATGVPTALTPPRSMAVRRTAASGCVDVIVPVHADREGTIRCIESVLGSRNATPFELVAVDDVAPDRRLTAWLEEQAAAGRLTLLRNAENLGFVRSVNRGLALHPTRDVLLLNSDTAVADGVVDRLRRAAHSAATIGAVTPFSNNATICSYPEMPAGGPPPGDPPLAELARLFAEANARQVIDLPVCHGFCVYLRRDALDEVGDFDAETFGRGYGEECDWSMRARAMGWRSVLAADTYVEHAGGRSFREEKAPASAENGARLRARYPDYSLHVRRFVEEDPARAARRAVDELRTLEGGR